jgi:hypothetical protein
MAARKPKAKAAPRSKITIEIKAHLKRRLMAFSGATGESAWRVVDRAVERELEGFYFATRERPAGEDTDRSRDDAPRLKAV